MAKVSFNKLCLKLNQDIKTIEYNNQIIEIKQYLSIQEKLLMISDIINNSHEDDINYSNPVKINVFISLEIIFNYTNINFTEKQKEDLPKLYDILSSTGFIDLIMNEIPQSELDMINAGVKECVKAIYDYQTSILGILQTIKTDYSDTNFDLNNIQDFLQSDDLSLLKDVIGKLG